MKNVFFCTSALALMLAAPTNSQAADADAGAADVDEVIVTGTRVTGLKAVDSPAPIQVLGANALARTGQPDLIQALAQNVPSFNAQGFGGDTANLTLSAKLRGLSPNHALVLVNGKRRHTTSNLAVLGGPYQGGAAADLNFIPVGGIERIEVLLDGAAAQYGTDAIAGVVNIILKKNSSGGSIVASGGSYFEGDGETADLMVNMGFEPFPNAYLNITGETKYHGFSDRGGIDPRVVDPANVAGAPLMLLAPGYPHLNKIIGDARYNLNVVTYNAGYELGGGTEFYSFGSYGRKYAAAFENYRLPSRIPGMYPFGFNPMETIKEKDYEAAAGFKGTVAEDWTWDLSTTYGKDDAAINVTNSGNASLFADTGASPSKFHAGDFIATRWTTNLDFSHPFDLGMAEPLNLAFGGEFRRETYEIKAGDPASRYKEGSQSYPGFSLTDAGKHSRKNYAVYADVALSPIDALKLDVAGRYEHFTDFGDTTVGKITARYDFSQMVAIRGTASTGFRAPTLAESYYSATNVGPTSAFVQLPPNSAGALLVGIDGLDAEKSTNYSIGTVVHPGAGVTMTLDAYQIEIRNRIAGSGVLYSAGGANNSPAVAAAIAANGNSLDPTVTFIGIQIFANGLDTRTRGLDFVATMPSDLGAYGHVDWSLTANVTKTKVTKIKASPSQLTPQTLYDAQAIADLEDTAPDYRVTLGALWELGRWMVNLRESIYGPSSGLNTYDGGTYYRTKISTKAITDLEITFKITEPVKFTVGANNLFDTRPNKVNSDMLAIWRANNDNSAVGIYPSFSPIGINGGYYYAKASYTF